MVARAVTVHCIIASCVFNGPTGAKAAAAGALAVLHLIIVVLGLVCSLGVACRKILGDRGFGKRLTAAEKSTR